MTNIFEIEMKPAQGPCEKPILNMLALSCVC